MRTHTKVRNDNIRERMEADIIPESSRKARLRWFGHVKRRNQEYVERNALEMLTGLVWSRIIIIRHDAKSGLNGTNHALLMGNVQEINPPINKRLRLWL